MVRITNNQNSVEANPMKVASVAMIFMKSTFKFIVTKTNGRLLNRVYHYKMFELYLFLSSNENLNLQNFPIKEDASRWILYYIKQK